MDFEGWLGFSKVLWGRRQSKQRTHDDQGGGGRNVRGLNSSGVLFGYRKDV